MAYSTSDLCDSYPELVRVVDPLFKHYGKKGFFGGEIITIKCFEDNSFVKETAKQDGKGMVMVIDGGGSMRCALLGDMIAEDASKNGWEGIIIYGAIRDIEMINEMNIGVKALGSIPLKTKRKGLGELNVPVKFGGVMFVPGEFAYADHTGIVVSSEHLSISL